RLLIDAYVAQRLGPLPRPHGGIRARRVAELREHHRAIPALGEPGDALGGPGSAAAELLQGRALLLGEGIEGVDADDVELTGDHRLLDVVPVARVGEQTVIALPHLL